MDVPYKIDSISADVMLEVLNLDKKETISIDTVSDQDFSEVTSFFMFLSNLLLICFDFNSYYTCVTYINGEGGFFQWPINGSHLDSIERLSDLFDNPTNGS